MLNLSSLYILHVYGSFYVDATLMQLTDKGREEDMAYS